MEHKLLLLFFSKQSHLHVFIYIHDYVFGWLYSLYIKTAQESQNILSTKSH